MATIFHLALASDWAAAQEAGAYTISTRGRTLAEEGFIHASRGDQWPKVREMFYSDVTEPLLLLQIDADRLDVPVVEEPPAPGVTETFPHIYGPIPLDAVVKAIPLAALGSAPPAPRRAAAAPPPAPAPPVPARKETFGRFFLWEMLRNTTLLILVMITTAVGYLVGSGFGAGTPQTVGTFGGLALGVLLARAVYVRRRP